MGDAAVGPAVDPRGQKWIRGDMSTEEYFAEIRREAKASAAKDIRKRRRRILLAKIEEPAAHRIS